MSSDTDQVHQLFITEDVMPFEGRLGTAAA
jgi:hypothetical protein